MTPLERARELAAFAHEAAGQKYNGQPYVVHLDAVVEVLKRFGVEDEDILVAGYLHDILEDTEASKVTLAFSFGVRAIEIVDAVTDGEGKNRRERKARPYRLIPKVPGALVVKLADRIANIESAAKSNLGLLEMYRKEQGKFISELYDEKHVAMFDHIDKLLLGDRVR